MNNCWAIDKSMNSFSTCHVGFLFWMAIWLIITNQAAPPSPGLHAGLPLCLFFALRFTRTLHNNFVKCFCKKSVLTSRMCFTLVAMHE